MKLKLAALLSLAFLLNACSSASPTPPAPGVKVGKPYSIMGETYYPEYDPHYDQTGTASWYGPGFHGKSTANGEKYNQHDLTAAHPTLPMPSLVRVTNLENGQSQIIRINDRGPFKDRRLIDLSKGSAEALGVTGLAKVRVQYLKDETEQYWAQMNLGKGQIEFAKRDPYAPKESDWAAGNRGGYDGMIVPQDNISGQVQDAAPVTSVASEDLPPPPGHVGVLTQPVRFKLIGDAEAAPLKPPPAPDATPEEEESEQAIEEANPSSGNPKAVRLIDGEGNPIPSGPSKVVRVSEPVYLSPPNAQVKGNTSPRDSPGWYVQAGAFASEENARRLARQLEPSGTVDVNDIFVSGQKLHRVRMGPFDSRSAAEQALGSAVSAGASGARVVQN